MLRFIPRLLVAGKGMVAKPRLYAQQHPKLARPLFAASALIVILLISVLIALLVQKDEPAPRSLVAPVQPAHISITSDGFVPATLVVKRGTTIIWTNTDTALHQIQANPHPTGASLPSLKSELLNAQQTYEYIAGTTGTFHYHDHVNPTSNGVIEVQ